MLADELRASMQRLRKLAEECAGLRAGAREAHFDRPCARVERAAARELEGRGRRSR